MYKIQAHDPKDVRSSLEVSCFICGKNVRRIPFPSMTDLYCSSLGPLLQVQCKEKLASQELTPETETYGDLGYKCMGNTGRYLTEFLIFISQCGGAVAYLVFIGQNLSSVFKGHGLSLSSFIFLLVPIEIALSWIHSLSSLAPFSIFADICNVLAMAVVLKEDLDKVISGEFRFGDRKAITSSIGGLPFAAGMAVFCFEGFGMTLSLEASMKERGGFASLLAKAFSGITLLYVLFGFSGYMAYGDETKDIITLNLPNNWSTIAVQVMCSCFLQYQYVTYNVVTSFFSSLHTALVLAQGFPFLS
jgi:proton-coupled amino acid transporter